MDQQYGADTRWLLDPLLVVAAARTGLEQYDAALRDLDRARVIATREQLPGIVAAIDFQQAHVLWDSNQDRPRARELARDAAEVQRRAGALRTLAEIEAWLQDHPLPSP
jgi:hypothetical protein